jgi:hypothetical protein
MAIGGFNGTDNAPTLAQLKAYVADGKIHYFIGGGGFDRRVVPEVVPAASSQIAQWVAANYTDDRRHHRLRPDGKVQRLGARQPQDHFSRRAARKLERASLADRE